MSYVKLLAHWIYTNKVILDSNRERCLRTLTNEYRGRYYDLVKDYNDMVIGGIELFCMLPCEESYEICMSGIDECNKAFLRLELEMREKLE